MGPTSACVTAPWSLCPAQWHNLSSCRDAVHSLSVVLCGPGILYETLKHEMHVRIHTEPDLYANSQDAPAGSWDANSAIMTTIKGLIRSCCS